jgi:hypothetical protein
VPNGPILHFAEGGFWGSNYVICGFLEDYAAFFVSGFLISLVLVYLFYRRMRFMPQ